jgi:hypothetical protein
MEPAPCEKCGDLIRVPVPRPEGWIICESCWETLMNIPKRRPKSRKFPAERADRQYHGGRWKHGEW